MQARPMQVSPAKVVGFSLDYDNCADILGPERLNHIRSFYSVDRLAGKGYFVGIFNVDKQQRLAGNLVLEQRRGLTEHMDSIIDREKHTYGAENIQVVIYVGSMRQDIYLDELGAMQNKNGSCFENYKKLCEEKGWILKPMLEADSHYSDSTPSAMFNPNKISQADRNKLTIVPPQIKDLRQSYPDSDIEFHFLDDDPAGDNIMESLKSDITENKAEILGDRTTVHLTRFTYVYTGISEWLLKHARDAAFNRWPEAFKFEEIATIRNEVDLSFQNAAVASASGFFSFDSSFSAYAAGGYGAYSASAAAPVVDMTDAIAPHPTPAVSESDLADAPPLTQQSDIRHDVDPVLAALARAHSIVSRSREVTATATYSAFEARRAATAADHLAASMGELSLQESDTPLMDGIMRNYFHGNNISKP